MSKKNDEDRPYGRSAGAFHQDISRSNPCDSHGGTSKRSQQVRQEAPAVAACPPERGGSKDQKTFDPREPKPKGAYPNGATTTRVALGAKSKGPVDPHSKKGY